MLIGLCGQSCAGKSVVADYLVNEHGFLYLNSPAMLYPKPSLSSSSSLPLANGNGVLTNGNCVPLFNTQSNNGYPVPSANVLSQCWRSSINVVIDSVSPLDSNLNDLMRRPYFVLVYVNAPLHIRFARYCARTSTRRSETSLIQFLKANEVEYHQPATDASVLYYGPGEHDYSIDNDNENQSNMNGNHSTLRSSSTLHLDNSLKQDICIRDRQTNDKKSVEFSLSNLEHLSRFRLFNPYNEKSELYEALRKFGFGDVRQMNIRPRWDSYFMSIASLASERSNCMKRRVGCVVVRDRRIVSSGYNGTPSGVTNCFDGGCPRCNGSRSGQLDLCLCLHAEENAIIEAGRDRCSKSTLYSTLFPCILCAKKIVQAGIERVVYDTPYSNGDTASMSLMKAGGIVVDQFSTPATTMSLQMLSDISQLDLIET